MIAVVAQVIDVSTSKTGKHGHAKCNFTATDIFTGKKLEDMCPSTHNVEVRSRGLRCGGSVSGRLLRSALTKDGH